MNTPLHHNVARTHRLAIEIIYRPISIHIAMPTLFINALNTCSVDALVIVFFVAFW